MPAYLSPIGNEQQSDANGAPVNGALIYTYVAGTTALVATYTDADGLVPQTNPIECNAAGFPPSPIYLPAGVAVKMVFTTSVASGSVAYRPPVDDITGVNDPAFTTSLSQWIQLTGALTYISATSFSIAGDQTNILTVNRRVQTTNTGGTVTSTILTSSFAAGSTTITLSNDSGNLDAGLSALSYGILSSVAASIPPTFDSYNIISKPWTGNLIRNGSFAINQRVTLPTADNTYGLDGWRLLVAAANAAVWTQDTADVPTGAGYASVLTVGASANQKFGIFQPIESRFMLAARGQTISLRVPLKATAGLTNGTGKIRVGVMQWTGVADAVSGDPVVTWNVEGANPLLLGGWAFINTPTAISVTTSWQDYLFEGLLVSGGATNLGLMIWSDETSNTTGADVLRIGGYVTLSIGMKAPLGQVAPLADELARCQRYYWKSFPQGTAVAQNAGQAGQIRANVAGSSVSGIWGASVNYPVVMRATPTITSYNPQAAAATWNSVSGAATSALGLGTNSDRGVDLYLNGGSAFSQASAEGFGIHFSATAEL